MSFSNFVITQELSMYSMKSNTKHARRNIVSYCVKNPMPIGHQRYSASLSSPAFDSFSHKIVSGDNDFPRLRNNVISLNDDLSVKIHDQVRQPIGECFVPLRKR